MFHSKVFTLIFLICTFFFTTGFSGGSDFQIDEFIKSGVSQNNKIEYFSEQFLGNKYATDPLGEGEADVNLINDDTSANYDKDPLYRFDKFDCMTFVETVLALSVSGNFDSFKNNMNSIRYKNGEVGFFNRNHFMALDWIPNNSSFVMDNTNVISTYEVSTLTRDIDKKKWFKKKHSFDSDYLLEGASIDYIPMNKINYDAIPSGSIVNIVKPFSSLKNSIGTDMLVFHTGFAIRKDGKLYFRHASFRKSGVVDEDFKEYLRQYKSTDGINVLKVLN